MAVFLVASRANPDDRKDASVAALRFSSRGEVLGATAICELGSVPQQICLQYAGSSAELRAELEEWQLEPCPVLRTKSGEEIAGTDELFLMYWACRPGPSAFYCATSTTMIFETREVFLSSDGSRALVYVSQTGYQSAFEGVEPQPLHLFGSDRSELVETEKRDGRWFVRGSLTIGRE